MTLSSGFFNSINEDRLYNAEDFANYLSGIIGDGYFPQTTGFLPQISGEAIGANPPSIRIGAGKAYCKGMWMINDTEFVYYMDSHQQTSPNLYHLVYLCFDTTDNVREASIKCITSASPTLPTDTVDIFYMLLAKVADQQGTQVGANHIEDLRPYAGVSGVTVYTSSIVDLAVTTPKINDLAITNAKMAVNAVNTSQVVNLAINNDKMADNAITTAKIVDLNVTTGKLAANAVITEKILDLNVTSGKLASNAVTTAKITDLNVTGGKIAASTITVDKMAASSVGTSNLVDKSITRNKLNAADIILGRMTDVSTSMYFNATNWYTIGNVISFTPSYDSYLLMNYVVTIEMTNTIASARVFTVRVEDSGNLMGAVQIKATHFANNGLTIIPFIQPLSLVASGGQRLIRISISVNSAFTAGNYAGNAYVSGYSMLIPA